MALRIRERTRTRESAEERMDASERAEKIREILQTVASEQNDTLTEPLLDESGRIDIGRYGAIDPDDETELADRQRFLRSQKDEWLGLHRPAAREALAKRTGISIQGLSEADQIETLRQTAESEHEKKDGSIAEGVITALFHRAYGQEYFVARTNEWDDFQHGADMMLVNRKTGEAVCAFDDVADQSTARGKEKKIARLNSQGGTKLEYGVRFREGRISKERLRGIPAFYLRLGPNDLDELVQELSETGSLSFAGSRMLNILILDIEKQVESLLESDAPGHLKQATEKFREGALKEMSERAQELRRAARE